MPWVWRPLSYDAVPLLNAAAHQGLAFFGGVVEDEAEVGEVEEEDGRRGFFDKPAESKAKLFEVGREGSAAGSVGRDLPESKSERFGANGGCKGWD